MHGFYEGDQIVLLDYKTDRVLKGQEQKLKERYQAQLDYYAKALKQTTGHEVKEKIIYAFSLQEGIAHLILHFAAGRYILEKIWMQRSGCGLCSCSV